MRFVTVNMPRQECTPDRLERAVSQDPVLKRKLDDVEERKRNNLAVEVEPAVNQASSVTERQFGKVPSSGFFGGATISSDPLGSTSAAISAQTFGRGQTRILPEDDTENTEPPVHSTSTNTERTELHSMITFHHANTRGSRAGRLRIAHLCVLK